MYVRVFILNHMKLVKYSNLVAVKWKVLLAFYKAEKESALLGTDIIFALIKVNLNPEKN